MSRTTSILAIFGMTLAWFSVPALYAQGQLSQSFPQLVPSTRATATTNYYEDKLPAATTGLLPSAHYDAMPGYAPLLPTIADGIRNTLNCLLPRRGSGRLGLGGPLLGNRGGAGLFSVRFYEGCGCGVPIPRCGCGIPVPRCGCGIQVIDEGMLIPTPGGGIPNVNPPKPVPDSAAFYYQRTPRQTIIPAVYHPEQLRGVAQPVRSQVIPASYYRASPIPNPLRQ